MAHADAVIEALAVLGLDASTTDPTVVRAAYLSAVRRSHPDRNRASDANRRTASLTAAYRIAIDGLADLGDEEPPADAAPEPPPPPAIVDLDLSALVRIIADDTIEVAAPPDITFAWLVQAGHVAGDVTFLDRPAALLQILVAFVGEPWCQMIFDLQGRAARGTTEIFCTIESIEDRPGPPIDAATRFVADQLAEVINASIDA